jgi:hypothetical protein
MMVNSCVPKVGKGKATQRIQGVVRPNVSGLYLF